MEQVIVQSDPDPDGRSWKEIIADIIRDIESIFKNEIRLAGVELKTKFKKSAKAVGLLAAAGLLGFFAMACFVMTVVIVLSMVLPLWLSSLIVGVLLAVIAGGAYLLGRMALEEVDPVPQRTVETLKDDVEWVRSHTKS